MFVIIFSNGQVNLSELSFECREKKWIPLAAIKHNSGAIQIPCFDTVELAKQFAKRNLPKEWIRGAIQLGEKEIDFIIKKGWAFKKFTYPNLLKDKTDIEFSFEILDFCEKPELLYS